MADERERASRGVVRRVGPKVKPRGGDLDFAADYTVTSTDDNGGRVLTDVEVIVCYWGGFWSATPAPSPSSDEYTTAISGILTGPYMGGLSQYRGVGQGTLIYTEINDSTDPAERLYRRRRGGDAQGPHRITTRMPAPTAGHNRFYAVIAPQGIKNSITSSPDSIRASPTTG